MAGYARSTRGAIRLRFGEVLDAVAPAQQYLASPLVRPILVNDELRAAYTLFPS